MVNFPSPTFPLTNVNSKSAFKVLGVVNTLVPHLLFLLEKIDLEPLVSSKLALHLDWWASQEDIWVESQNPRTNHGHKVKIP